MALILREPFRELQALRDRINHLFEDTIVRHGSALLADLTEQPAMDVYEDDGMLVIEAHMPGFLAEDIAVGLTNHTLTIKAQRATTEQVKEKTYHRREIHLGALVRSIVLPDEVDTATLEATLANGVLTLRAKKMDSVSPTTIAVKSVLKEAAVG